MFARQEDFLSNIVHFSNVGSMLGQRRRCWPNTKTALGESLIGVVSSLVIRLLNQRTTMYCMLKAYTNTSLEHDSILKCGALSMSLTAVLFRFPYGAGFSEK